MLAHAEIPVFVVILRRWGLMNDFPIRRHEGRTLVRMLLVEAPVLFKYKSELSGPVFELLLTVLVPKRGMPTRLVGDNKLHVVLRTGGD